MTGVEGAVPLRSVDQTRIPRVGPRQRALHEKLGRRDESAVDCQRLREDHGVLDPRLAASDVQRIEDQRGDDDGADRCVAQRLRDRTLVSNRGSVEGIHLARIARTAGLDQPAGGEVR